MGRPFDQQLIITDSDTHEKVSEAEAQENQLTEDLVDLWEVFVTQYVLREARERAIPEGTVHGELTVNTLVFDLLESLVRLLAQSLIELQD